MPSEQPAGRTTNSNTGLPGLRAGVTMKPPMMTRTTLKLWFGGGGVLATWLAVSPNHGQPPAASTSALEQPAQAPQATAESLNAQADRLRDRTATLMRPPTRNPFQFKSRRSAEPSGSTVARVEEQAIAPVPVPPLPALKLAGIAHQAGRRTAILSNDGEIYLAGDGDSVAGRYTIIKVDPEAVLMRDESGAERRLVLPQ